MKKCMIVDDSKVVRKVVKRIIEDLDFVAIEACDGREAFNKCDEELPDCILLDWNMPVMDGMEFLKEFRKNSKNNAVKVIFCTNETDVNKIQKAMKAGADEYIMKPFDIDIVRDKFIQVGMISCDGK